MSGFIDAHAHYPQTPIIASWGKRLIDWLNTYTFPEEEKYGNLKYAEKVAELYLNFFNFKWNNFGINVLHNTSRECGRNIFRSPKKKYVFGCWEKCHGS
jgi:hypothetical protein